jgi:hypothetical protein
MFLGRGAQEGRQAGKKKTLASGFALSIHNSLSMVWLADALPSVHDELGHLNSPGGTYL